MIGVVDFGVSNVGSVLNMFKYVGHDAKPISSVRDLETCSKIVLPGVGSFDSGMSKLVSSGLVETLNRRVIEDSVPVLGICLGMQLMCLSSEEGTSAGLGWIDAVVRDFRRSATPPSRTPHMGWNAVTVRKPSDLIADFDPEARFYFVHSYYVDCFSCSDVLLTTRYGVDFVSAFQRANIMGTQFHPEKSHVFGANLFKNFGAL